jgi:phenylacetate-CoA ligase
MNEWIKFYAKNNIFTHTAQRKIERLYQLSEDELLSLYEQRFLNLFRYAYKHSPFYTKLYTQHQIGLEDVKHLSDIQKLPTINRNSIKNNIEEVYNSHSFLKVIGLTSGTSGTPLTLYRTIFDISTEQAYIKHYRGLHGYQLGQPLLSIRGVLGKSTPYEYYKKANILYISSPNINASTIDMYYQMVKDFGPVAVEAFPSYLHKFCMELEKKGYKLEIPNSFTSSETLLSVQRAKIEPYLKTNIHDWYGNAERSILLAENAEHQYYPLPLYSVNEYASNHVITTNLINKRFPLIRYVVDDVVEVAPASFEKNIVSPTILSIQGRVSENVELKDGSLVGCLDHTFKGVKHIEMAQIHQYNVQDPIEVKLVTTPAFSSVEEAQLRNNWVRMVGTEMEIKFTYCSMEDLTTFPNQKYRLIIKKKP